MNKDLIKTECIQQIKNFSLPMYESIPTVGYFLEQTVDYINQCLAPLPNVRITSSMVRNYVKQGLITNPIRKKYNQDQIAYLLCITVLKQVVSLEDVQKLFGRQKKVYSNRTAYEYFRMELKNVLDYQFGIKHSLDVVGTTHTLEKEILRSDVIAVSNILYIQFCFDSMQ